MPQNQDAGGNSEVSVDFTYEIRDFNASEYGGLVFVLQRSNVLDVGCADDCLGYFGINSSIGITLELYESLSALYRDGLLFGGSNPTAPMNFMSGNPIHVSIQYDGGLVIVDMIDTVTGNAAPTRFYPIDIPETIGGTSAWVGFTTGTRFGINQFLDDFTFISPDSSCPTPEQGDLDHDGDVDITDLATVLSFFGTTCQ